MAQVSGSEQQIPVVSFEGPTFAAEFLDACREYGFVSVTGHGIGLSQFDEMRNLLKRLFAVSDSEKQVCRVQPGNYRGFIPLGFFTPNRPEANGPQPDRYEGYKLHWECPASHPVRTECDLYGPNIWAPSILDMEETIGRYWQACDRLASQLLRIFALDLGIPENAFADLHEAPLTNMTLLHYPPAAPARRQVGMHPHKDTNVITFLHPGPVGGLKIRTKTGGWIDATPPPDALLVNIGEMLELWSGGRYPATPHQVLNPSGEERYSFPYFVVPNHSVVVEALVEPQPGFKTQTMPVGELSAEVWRTNWPDEEPSDAGFDLGTLDRTKS